MCDEVAQTEESIELEVDFQTANKVNFASSQNGVSIIKKIVLKNCSEDTLENIVASVECSPGLIRPKSWTLDRLASGDEISLSDLQTPLDTALLKGLNEAELGTLRLKIDCESKTLTEETRQIEMLARDEWGGIGEMAQLLAAFVSPNDTVVASILKEAARLLESAGQNGAINGYQSRDPNRAWMLAGAIWSAATGLGLTYAVPPASFEYRGQKVRDPGRIKSEGLATCLDSALLLAACFEAAGLNPVVLFATGHAWVGVWLVDRDFGSVSEPDVISVRKALDAREFVTVETTLLSSRPSVGFEEAVASGRDHTTERNEHDFLLAVDIGRARAARIRSLANHRVEEFSENSEVQASPAALPKPLNFDILPDEFIEEEPATASDRISRWQRKLLDLSLRNRLLNFRDTKQTLPFLCPDVSALEDGLADGKRFKTLPLKEEDPLGERDLLAGEEQKLLEDVALNSFSKDQIAVPLTRKETERRLLELHRRAKSDMQEGGTNTLFLAAGFLRWKKTEGDTRSYKAPLLLIPVKLSRRSAQSDFILEHHEDDVRFNATLLEFLKRDFDLRIPELEGELPRDESGYDLPRIFELLRRKVRDVAGFEVIEELSLSTFSFAKFLMWKDLVDRTDKLRESRLVKHLVDNPTEPFLAEGAPGLAEAVDVDRRIKPSDLFTPLPADSSQLAAVLSAQEGHDFVLIGPPGTGKSQTIANIISQCLALGKTVLFVAEKAAALDVVHRRLSAHGLGDAVLELHSNKSDRKSVLNQLGRSWGRAAQASEQEWIKLTDELAVTREQLNAYVTALHRIGAQGFSIFQAIGASADREPPFDLTFDNMDAHDAESYERLIRLAEDVERRHNFIKDAPEFPLVQSDDCSFRWQDEILKRATTLKTETIALSVAAKKLANIAGLTVDEDCSPESLETLLELAHIAVVSEDVTWAIFRDIEKLKKDAEGFEVLLKKYRASVSKASASYPMDRLQGMPLEQLDANWRLAQTKMWPFSVFAKSSVRKLLQTYAVNGTADPSSDIEALIVARQYREEIDKHPLINCPVISGVETDIERLTRWIGEAKMLRTSLDKLSPHVAEQSAWDIATRELSSGKNGELQQSMSQFRQCYESWVEHGALFEGVAKADPKIWSLTELNHALDQTISNKGALSNWTRWVEVYLKASEAGLSPLVNALEDGTLNSGVKQAFEAAYANWWLPLALDADEVLRGFSHWAHEDIIQRFRDLDAEATKQSSAQVLRRVQHGLPKRDNVPRRSALGVLGHQIGLQRPSMPIRSLILEMSDTFTKLAPCVLMSPLSVAQYLPAGQAAFDVVIFDEASQITTWDAVGAIARGRQAIIVGDPKQLPPTNFFGRSDGGEDDLPEIERDLASILDEVVSSGIPTQQLNWHYRSRDEALIAFSNWHYYDGRLVTFPSPVTASNAIQLHQMNGVYGRGKGRTNEVEARAVVQMIVRRLNEWLLLPEQERLTLGVITFNIEQQGLILDLLDAERRKNPDLEWFFEDAREEPVIVKNLENIQGDERDVMLFSITFGPDHAGKLSMAFGALNGDGGEKRLNVAVTRARQELHVFASITADEIDLTRTKKIGVKHLKNFLDFAARGPVALPAEDDGSLGAVENIFEEAIKVAIEAKGWELRSQIGVSGYRIDLGVVHPDHAGAYLAGIECDGASYHGAANVRDRDKVRQAVLENLGWSIVRIWSTDWFRDPKSVVERIHEFLNTLLEEDRAARQAEIEANSAEETQAEVDPSVEEEHVAEIQAHEGSSDIIEPEFTEEEGREALDELPVRQEPLVARTIDQPVKTTPLERSDALRPDPDRFYEESYLPTLESLIGDIVQSEGPMPLSLLGRRISALHGWQRTGRRIAQQVRTALVGVEIHKEGDVEFVWSPGSYTNRLAFRHGTGRAIRDISRTEIANLYDQNKHTLASGDDPILELGRIAGISRLSSDARAYLEDCVKWSDLTSMR